MSRFKTQLFACLCGIFLTITASNLNASSSKQCCKPCTICPTCPIGPTGPTGPGAGATGPTGPTGSTGPTGLNGLNVAPAYSYFYSTGQNSVSSGNSLIFNLEGQTNGAVSQVTTATGTQFAVRIAGLYSINYGFYVLGDPDNDNAIGTGQIQFVYNATPVNFGTLQISDADAEPLQPIPDLVSGQGPGYENTQFLYRLNVGDVVSINYVTTSAIGNVLIGTDPAASGVMGTTIAFIKLDN